MARRRFEQLNRETRRTSRSIHWWRKENVDEHVIDPSRDRQTRHDGEPCPTDDSSHFRWMFFQCDLSRIDHQVRRKDRTRQSTKPIRLDPILEREISSPLPNFSLLLRKDLGTMTNSVAPNAKSRSSLFQREWTEETPWIVFRSDVLKGLSLRTMFVLLLRLKSVDLESNHAHWFTPATRLRQYRRWHPIFRHGRRRSTHLVGQWPDPRLR